MFIESAVSDEEAIWVKITEPKAVKMIRDSYDEKLSELIEKLVDEEQEENDSQNAIEEEEEEQEKEEEEEEEEEEVNQENQDEVEEANYSESSESNLESEDSQSLVNTQQSQQPRNKATRKRNHTMVTNNLFDSQQHDVNDLLYPSPEQAAKKRKQPTQKKPVAKMQVRKG